VPLLLLLGANVAATVFLVVPLTRSVSGKEADALEALTDLANARREEAQARAARESTVAANEDLRTFYERVLPGGFDGAVQVTSFWLNRIAERSGVVFERGKYDREPVEESSLERMTAQATLKGDYDGVRRFIHAVETADQFVSIDRIELARPNDLADDRLELLLEVSTYYLRSTPPSVSGGKP